MKRFLFTTILCLFVFFGYEQESFIIDGYPEGLGAVGQKIILCSPGYNNPALDSAIIDRNGRFQLKESAPSHTMMVIKLTDVTDFERLHHPVLVFFC